MLLRNYSPGGNRGGGGGYGGGGGGNNYYMPFPAEDGPTSATSSQWNGLKSDGLRSYTYSGGGGSALPGQGNPIYQPPPGERKKELDRFF